MNLSKSISADSESNVIISGLGPRKVYQREVKKCKQ